MPPNPRAGKEPRINTYCQRAVCVYPVKEEGNLRGFGGQRLERKVSPTFSNRPSPPPLSPAKRSLFHTMKLKKVPLTGQSLVTYFSEAVQALQEKYVIWAGAGAGGRSGGGHHVPLTDFMNVKDKTS